MFKNAIIFRISPDWNGLDASDVENRLGGARFEPCGSTQRESIGFLEPRGEKHGRLLETVGGQWLLKVCVETKTVPPAAVKIKLAEALDKIEEQTGRRPKGKAMREVKEEIEHGMLPNAFPKRSQTTVWIDVRSRLVVVDASTLRRADAMVTLLVKTFDSTFALSLLQTEQSPSTAMAEWLRSKEAPSGFTVDRDCELKSPDSGRAAVKYSRHTLDLDEVAEHVAHGKIPTSLAMTWGSRISFVLSDTMQVKALKVLDLSKGKGKAEDFDADAAIYTGELAKLIPDLTSALGGELAAA